MGEIYLTKRLKQRYMNDFINNVLQFEKPAWRLDQGLDEILISVNNNPLIQSVYSRKDSFTEVEYLHESYVELCYSRIIELKIFREIIPSFNYDFIKEPNSVFYYQFSYPRQNPNYKADSEPVGLGCIDDEDYFKINTIRLTLESPIKTIHEKFWLRINEVFSKIDG